MSTSRITADDLICIQCGYDLRTLPADSNCPECGRAITDSVKMGPLIRWLPGFRSGVSFLCLAFLIGAHWIQRWVYEFAWDRFNVNSDGASAVFFALMFLPAAWFLTTPNPLRSRMLTARKWVLGLTIAQFILGVCELRFFRHPWPFDRVHGNYILMTAYALDPLVFVALLWFVLEILYRSLPLLGKPIPRWIYRIVQWPLIYSRLGPAIFFGIVCFARIKHDDPPPGSRYWINETLSRFLEAILIRPADLLLIPTWLSFLLILLYLRYRIRRSLISIAPP
jgi:hypothetical protein